MRIPAEALIAYSSVGFCVAVRQRKAMREASKSRTATDTDSCAFSFPNQLSADERKTEAKQLNDMSFFVLMVVIGCLLASE